MSTQVKDEKPRRWPIVMAYVSAFVFAAGSVQYSSHVDQQSNQRWCQLLGVLDGAYRMEPPKTPTGKTIAAAVHNLYEDFDC